MRVPSTDPARQGSLRHCYSSIKMVILFLCPATLCNETTTLHAHRLIPTYLSFPSTNAAEELFFYLFIIYLSIFQVPTYLPMGTNVPNLPTMYTNGLYN